MSIQHNPYQASRPITEPKNFFGRRADLQLIYEMLRCGDSLNLLGERGIGKSSVLLILPHPDMQRRIYGELIFDDCDVFAFLDMRSQTQAEPLQFFSLIADQLTKDSLTITPEITSYQDIDRVFEQLTSAGLRLRILLDEFDCVTQNAHFDVLFYDMLRYLQQQYRISYVIASSERIKYLCENRVTTSPFFNIFRMAELGPMKPDEAAALRDQSPELSDDQTFIHALSGQHPLFITQLCFHLFHLRQHQETLSTQKLRQEALHRFLEEALDHFIFYWDELSNDEKGLLKKLANNQQPTAEDTSEFIDLEKRALIIKHNGNYAIFSAAFEGFVKEIEFSQVEEQVAQFFAKNTKALVSVVKYCLDKAVELKK